MQSRPAPFPLLVPILCALASATPLAAAQVSEPKRIAEVPELAGFVPRWSGALATLDVPGFAVAVVKDGAVLAVDAFGVRDAAGHPATPDTCWYIASATKPFTAMAVCLLAGDGKVDLDAPVKKYLPQLELPDAELTEKLSLRDLLCHRPGIDCGPIVQRDAYTGQITDEIYFELLREADIAHQVQYSNVHFTLAARVIEAVSGKKWQDFLAERVFAPVGLTRTTAYASTMYGAGEHAEPMLLVDGKWLRSPLVKTDRTMHAAGGMGTTARDAGRWLLLNLNGGEIDGKKVLPKALAREYYTQQSKHPAPSGRIRIEEGFALGWGVGKYRDASRPYYFHGGGYVGAASYFCFLPNERIGVAVLANSDGGAAIATIVSIDVLDRMLGIEGQPDLLPSSEEQAKQRRAGIELPAGDNPARAKDGLTRPLAAYAGTYTHPLEGELEVLAQDGELTAHVGDLPYVLVSRGPDQFRAWVVPGMEKAGAFELDAQGKVVAVTLESQGSSARFERIGAN